MRKAIQLGLIILAVCLGAGGVSFGLAQQENDPLQGRLLQRSDGWLYIYRDGARYVVQPATLSDDVINAIPEAGPPVDRLDQFYNVAPPSPSPPPPPSPSAPPAPGTALYQADWSSGLNGWAGTNCWKTTGGMLVCDGTQAGAVLAPYQSVTNDYAVEAEMQLFSAGPYGLREVAGPTLRVDRNQPGYAAGLQLSDPTNNAVMIYAANEDLALPLNLWRKYDPGTSWHTYRFEAKGNQLRLLVDGAVRHELQDNRFLEGPLAGFISSVQLQIRSFRVIAL